MSAFSRMHDEYLDPKHLWPEEPPEEYQTVLDFFAAQNEEQCKRRIYKKTSCGAWLEFKESGIVIGSSVEGSDFGTATYPLHYAHKFTSEDIQARIDAVEKEASAIWEWSNVLRDKNGRRHRNGKSDADNGLDAPDVSYDYKRFEQGERSS